MKRSSLWYLPGESLKNSFLWTYYFYFCPVFWRNFLSFSWDFSYGSRNFLRGLLHRFQMDSSREPDICFLVTKKAKSISWELYFLDSKKNLSEEDKDMIVNEISLVIQKIFSVKQPKDQRSRSQMAQGIIQWILNALWKICSLVVNGQSFLVIDGYLLNLF